MLIILVLFFTTITFLSIKFGFDRFIGVFSSCIFLTGLFWVILTYFINKPDVNVDIQPLTVKRSSLTELYELQLSIKSDSGNHHFKEIIIYPEKGTLITNDINAEIINFYKRGKIKWPHNSGKRIDLGDFKSEGQSLGNNYPLVVPKGMKKSKMRVIIYVHINPYETGLLAIFNPIHNYVIKDEIEIDLKSVEQEIE